MVAVALLKGNLTAHDYENKVAADPWIDRLRNLMKAQEDLRYSKDYLDPDKRSIGNALQVHFKDGSSTARIEVEYPLGHRRRREESLPFLKKKYSENIAASNVADRAASLTRHFDEWEALEQMTCPALLDLLAAT
jgi:2-methylcitrate dehydratase PrpD